MSGSRPLILLRTDASQAIGTGHVRRCLALADALATLGARSLFVTRALGVDVGAWIRSAGHETILLSPPKSSYAPVADAPAHAAWAGVDQVQDSQDLLAAIQGRKVDAVVVDSYAFDARWHAAVRQGLAVPIVALDDLGDRKLAADIIVDHNLSADHRQKHAASLAAGARLLGGPRYALIDAAYAAAPRYAFSAAVRSIGIFLGGVDAGGLSDRVARALGEAGFKGTIEIATTSANPRLDRLLEEAAAIPAEVLVDQVDLAGFFARHDLQIGAGGGASWERCCIGAPTLTAILASNQRESLVPLAATGAVALMPEESTPEAIAETTMALVASPQARKALSERALQLVDGRGAGRVALAALAGTITVRPATAADGGVMHRWRNDPRTRAVSRAPGEISLATHLAWLDGVIARTDRLLLMAEIASRPVGVVRFDLAEPEAEVSIYLDPELGGLGLGPCALAASEAELARRLAAPVTLIAHAAPDNRPSRRLFAGAGYENDGTRFTKPLDPTRNRS